MSGNKSLSDNELVALLREGNHNAYTQIYNRYYYLMFVFAYKKLRDEELAKDFVQELFTRLWVKKSSLSLDGNFVQYLYISLRSKMFDYFDHQKVKSKYINFLTVCAEAPEEKTDYLIREKQLVDYIDKQIDRLPKKMKEVFELSRKQQLSNREIAKKINVTESNVSQHISNAVKILKTKLNSVFLLFFL